MFELTEEQRKQVLQYLWTRPYGTEALGPRSANRFHMYRGSRILELVERGLELEACSLELDACHLLLSKLGA
jgi:hypothetical protein